MKKCRFCQSEIDDKAIVCPVCRRDLVDVPAQTSKQQTTTENTSPIVFVVVGILAFVAVVVLVWYMGLT